MKIIFFFAILACAFLSPAVVSIFLVVGIPVWSFFIFRGIIRGERLTWVW